MLNSLDTNRMEVLRMFDSVCGNVVWSPAE